MSSIQKKLMNIRPAGVLIIALSLIVIFEIFLMFSVFWESLDFNNQIGIIIVTVTVLLLSYQALGKKMFKR